MARSAYQTLIRTPSLLASKTQSSSQASCTLTLRCLSNLSGNSKTVDSDSEPDHEAMAVQRIEDAIHRIIARRSAPDWLPFFPGSSYWVPPRRRSYGIAELVRKLANTLTEEEVMALTTVRGWPSSAYFVDGASSNPAKVESLETASKNTSNSEDEEQ